MPQGNEKGATKSWWGKLTQLMSRGKADLLPQETSKSGVNKDIAIKERNKALLSHFDNPRRSENKLAKERVLNGSVEDKDLGALSFEETQRLLRKYDKPKADNVEVTKLKGSSIVPSHTGSTGPTGEKPGIKA